MRKKDICIRSYILYPGVTLLYLIPMLLFLWGLEKNRDSIFLIFLFLVYLIAISILLFYFKRINNQCIQKQKTLESFQEELYRLRLEQPSKELLQGPITSQMNHALSMPILTQLKEKMLNELTVMPKLLSEIKGELASTNTITEEKVLRIVSALAEIRAQSKSLLFLMEAQEKKTGDLAEKQLARLEENAKTLRILSSYQEKRLSQIEDDTKRINEALREVKNLTTLTKLIREITEQTNLLALNAAVVAARSGSAGRAFSVIAREIRKLSQQIEDTTMMIETQVSSIVTHIENNLSAIVEISRTEEEKRQISLIMNTLTSMNQAFTEVSGYFADLFTESHKVMKDVYQKIIEALGDTQFQDVLKQRIQYVQEGLTVLEDYIFTISDVLQRIGKEEITDIDWPSLKKRVEKLNSRHPIANLAVRDKDFSIDNKRPSIELF